jgi:hypothetical protein
MTELEQLQIEERRLWQEVQRTDKAHKEVSRLWCGVTAQVRILEQKMEVERLVNERLAERLAP